MCSDSSGVKAISKKFQMAQPSLLVSFFQGSDSGQLKEQRGSQAAVFVTSLPHSVSSRLAHEFLPSLSIVTTDPWRTFAGAEEFPTYERKGSEDPGRRLQYKV